MQALSLSDDLLVVGNVGGLQVRFFDVSRPQPPGLVNQLAGLGFVRGVVDKDRAYLGSNSGEISVVDLSEPGRPRVLGCLGDVSVRAVHEGLAFIGDGTELAIWDVSNARHPTRLGGLTLPARVSDMTVSGTIAYVGLFHGDGRVLLLDVSRPSSPRIIGEIPPVSPSAVPSSLSVTGDLLVFRLNGSNPLVVEIVDVSNPADPRPLGRYTGTRRDNGGNLAVRGSFIYVATMRGLLILDMSAPEAPFLAARLPGDDAPWRKVNWVEKVTLAGDAVFMVGPDGQTVADISDPTHPRIAGGTTFNGSIVAVKDDFIYLSGHVSGLQVVQVNPLLPPSVHGSSSDVTLQVPAGMAPGSYHVRALQPSGETVFLYNALEITGDELAQRPLRPGRNRLPACIPGQ